MKLRQVPALLFVLPLSAGLLQCSSRRALRSAQGPAAATLQGKATQTAPDGLAAALAQARHDTQQDGLLKTFQVSAKLSLPGEQISNLNQFRVNRDRTLSVVDYERKQAELYDEVGQHARPLGDVGNAPGAHIWPSDAAETEDGIAVADFQSHRVNVFSHAGRFQSSFTYTPQNFSAQRLLYDDSTHTFYLLGNRWQLDGNGQMIGAELVHKYSASGDFVASYFPFPEQAKPLGLYNYDSPASDIASGDLFVAVPFDYTVYRLTSDGQFASFLTDANSTFRAPAAGLDLKGVAATESYKYVQNWRLTWTPINNLAVADGKLFVQYQTFDPLRYTLDVWSLATKKKTATVKTNYALLTKDAAGNLYFLENLEAKGQARYDIVRAKLKGA
jgi:hypothetical protein